MEGSPATRLPEADSLPDGFVESSAADQAPPPPADAGDPASRSLGLDQADATVGGGGGDETLGAPPSTLASVAQDTLDAYSAADALQSLTVGGSAAEPERALGEPAVDAGDAKESSKESSVVEQVESMADQKGSGEQKRKVVKKSKVEKDRELFELAQAYHKVVAERDAAIAVKEKLESLCREFQRQNKMLKEECRRVSTEGQNMRMELSDKFNNAIKDVSVKLDEQKNECIAQLEENNLLRSKLKDLADQYNITQQKYAHQLKEKMLELELADLKMQQHQEKTAQEQTQMQLYADQVSQLMSTEKNLRLQLAADGERFQQFQDALTKSNEVFETYKKEMEKMVKLIKDLKKDNEFMKSKCENSDVALVKLIEERELMKKQVDKFKNQKEKLESLCRSLQAERKQSPSGGTPDATSNETNLATIES
ncbi:beta-taxilin isoform X2 [Oryza sativa Japonica Group]|uniref:Alpha-taxilin, putative, expressed n=1 Tax=Oryza sativa subsp. japonica TaxID=39947 RepID=Q10MZ5_ORYSJ|nr:beta-taxilin isoform X4 [Oryza sativa Japonica Group]ABF95380.1 Alpha-taxilin, putative, expressed [Oryza sativa Japonica Group]